MKTTLEETFIKSRKSFSSFRQIYCPSCWQKTKINSLKKWFLIDLGFGLLGFLLVFLRPDLKSGFFLSNLFLFQLSLILTIVPHELGHALTARLLGLRVFKISIGKGKNIWKFNWIGFQFEIQPIPSGGLVLVAPRNLDFLRIKRIAYVAAGPLVNLILAASIIPLLDFKRHDVLPAFSMGLFPGYAFLYANLYILIANLWPRTFNANFGKHASDGKLLLKTPFMSIEDRQLLHITYFLLEAGWNYERRDLRKAIHWVEKGLEQYPEHQALLTYKGELLIEEGNYGGAKACLNKVLLRLDDEKPQVRALILNNIAYADVLCGGEEFIQEADTYSKEAFDVIGWNPAIRGTRGAVLVAIGQLEEGIKLLQESLEQTDALRGKAQNACLIAEAECLRGNREIGTSYLEEARRLDSECMLISRVEKCLDG